MEEYILHYLFESCKNTILKGNDYQVLIYLYKCSYYTGFSETIFVKTADVEDELGISKPSINSSIDNLQTAGLIVYKAFRGKKGGTLITLNFIKSILDRMDGNVKKHSSMNTILKNTIPEYAKHQENFIYDTENSTNEKDNKSDSKCKEFLHYNPFKYKESLQLNVKLPRNFTFKALNKAFLNIKKVYNLTSNDEDSLHYKPSNYQISLHFNIDANSLSIKDLQDLDDNRFKSSRLFLAQFSLLYNNIYIYIFNMLDQLFFQGNLINSLMQNENSTAENNTNSTDINDKFELTEDNIKKIPENLLSHKEKYLNETITFKEAYQQWIDYKKNIKKNPVTQFSFLKEIKWLSKIPNPVNSIMVSIRASSNSIFQDKSTKELSAYENNSKGEMYGIIRTFD